MILAAEANDLLPRRARFNFVAANQLTPTDLLIDSWLKVAAVPDIDFRLTSTFTDRRHKSQWKNGRPSIYWTCRKSLKIMVSRGGLEPPTR
jgi:hypothetical protein